MTIIDDEIQAYRDTATALEAMLKTYPDLTKNEIGQYVSATAAAKGDLDQRDISTSPRRAGVSLYRQFDAGLRVYHPAGPVSVDAFVDAMMADQSKNQSAVVSDVAAATTKLAAER